MALGAFDSPYPYHWEMIHDDYGWATPRGASYAVFETPGGRILVQFLTMRARHFDSYAEHVFPEHLAERVVLHVKQFNVSYKDKRAYAFDKLGWNIATRVLGTIAAMVREYVAKTDAIAVYYGAITTDRLRAYTRLAKRLKLANDVIATDGSEVFVLMRWGKKPLPAGMKPMRLPRRSRRVRRAKR